MNELERKGLQENLDLLIRKKNALQKDLTLAYDANQKFALDVQIEELEKQINDSKSKLSEINVTGDGGVYVDNSSQSTDNRSTVKGNSNVVIQNVGGDVNVTINKKEAETLENYEKKYATLSAEEAEAELKKVQKEIDKLEKK